MFILFCFVVDLHIYVNVCLFKIIYLGKLLTDFFEIMTQCCIFNTGVSLCTYHYTNIIITIITGKIIIDFPYICMSISIKNTNVCLKQYDISESRSPMALKFQRNIAFSYTRVFMYLLLYGCKN